MKIESYDYPGLRDYFDGIENAEVTLVNYYQGFIALAVGYVFLSIQFTLANIFIFSNIIVIYIIIILVAPILLFLFSQSIKPKVVKYFKIGTNDYKIFYFFNNKLEFINSINNYKIVYNKKKMQIKSVKQRYMERTFWKLNLDKETKKTFEEYFSNITFVNDVTRLNETIKVVQKSSAYIENFDSSSDFKKYPDYWEFNKTINGDFCKVRYLDRISSRRWGGTLKFENEQIIKHIIYEGPYRHYNFTKINSKDFKIRLPYTFVNILKEKGFDLTVHDCVVVARDDEFCANKNMVV